MNEQLSLFKKWLQENKLVHVEIVIRKVGRRGVFGRLVSVDEDKELIVFYDEDQKQVLSFHVNQIDSITPAADTSNVEGLVSR